MNSAPLATDWDRYYAKPFAATKVTRRITGRKLASLIRRFAPLGGEGVDLVEIGGANSCFFDRLFAEFRPRRYRVIDFNRFGLDKMAQRLGKRDDVEYHHADVLRLELDMRCDLVISIGLVEHFSPAQSAEAIAAHFRLLRDGGIAIISFPTPTPLYCATRGLAEAAGKWEFPDERPLRLPEVRAAIEPHGELLHSEIVWPIMLTQMFVVARKGRSG
jgi:SAM-dependent methyltransferase